MTDADAFLQAIRENPADDGPRLIYADWLEERGDPRAEFIRVECELARLPGDDPHRHELWKRDVELILAYKEVWWPYRTYFHYWECRRGFIEVVHANVTSLLEAAAVLFRDQPVQDLWVDGRTGNISRLAACPHLVSLPRLRLSHQQLLSEHVRSLAASPHLSGLTTLDLSHNNIDTAGAEALAAAPYLTQLTRLDLRNNNIGTAGGQALAQSRHLERLTWLDLRHNAIDASGRKLLRRLSSTTRRIVVDNRSVNRRRTQEQ
jgi:uncharacterized protein (TIGR02996 family)